MQPKTAFLFLLPLSILLSSCEKNKTSTDLTQDITPEDSKPTFENFTQWPPCEKKSYDTWVLDSASGGYVLYTDPVANPINMEGLFHKAPIDSVRISQNKQISFFRTYGVIDSTFDCTENSFYFKDRDGFTSGTFLSDTVLHIRLRTPTHYYRKGSEQFYYHHDYQYILKMRTVNFSLNALMP